AEDDINYFYSALKYGKSYRPEDIELPFSIWKTLISITHSHSVCGKGTKYLLTCYRNAVTLKPMDNTWATGGNVIRKDKILK
ncbi:MAG: hypothetical protein II453_00620, partial [Alphaproteobacteria bacterium]|nr:hypothetical protein [Alphaproteobacteria bacterium]